MMTFVRQRKTSLRKEEITSWPSQTLTVFLTWIIIFRINNDWLKKYLYSTMRSHFPTIYYRGFVLYHFICLWYCWAMHWLMHFILHCRHHGAFLKIILLFSNQYFSAAFYMPEHGLFSPSETTNIPYPACDRGFSTFTKI